MSIDTGHGTPRSKIELPPCSSAGTQSDRQGTPVAEATNCTASRHGSRAAYVQGCRCDTAVHAHFRYEKQLRAEHKRGQRRRVPVAGTRRRLQALCAIGYSQPELATLLGVSQQCVWQHLAGPRPTVLRGTVAKVAALYVRLGDVPSCNPRAARTTNTARRNGWLGPLWWDEDTIDDPAYSPLFIDDLSNLSKMETRSTPTTSSPAASSPDVDPIVVERLIDGQPPLHVTYHERAAAVRELHRRGRTASQISCQLHMSGGRVAQILAGSVRVAADTHDDNDRQEASA